MTDVALNPGASRTEVEHADVITRIFAPPSEIAGNAEWVSLYEAMVTGLRRDAAGLPLDMAQTLLIERQATTYIRLKWYEVNGGMSTAQLAKLDETYLKHVTQFQKILSSSDEALRQDLLLKTMDIAEAAVELFEDKEIRNKLRQHFKGSYAQMGW